MTQTAVKAARAKSPRAHRSASGPTSQKPRTKQASAKGDADEVGGSPVRRYHHGNLREELIRCGKARLRTEGLVDLSLRKIAADAGVSQVAPKHHFGNKEGLLAAIAASGFRDLTEFRHARLKSAMTAEQRLRSLLTSYVQFAIQNPALFHLMFAPEFKAPETHSELNETASQSYHMLERGAQEYLQEVGETDANSPSADDIARVAWLTMHGLATLSIENRINPIGAPRYSREQLTNRLLDWVFAAVHTIKRWR